MVSLPVYDRSGEEVGTYEIDPAELSPQISKQLLHDVVVMYQTNQRQGSAKTKSRAEISGSTGKMYRQKGTGNARAGSRRSGLRRGGGRIFANRPRDWSFRLPKKAVRLATRMALASRISDNEVTLIDELSFEEPKTGEMMSILEALADAGAMDALLEVEKKRKAAARRREAARREKDDKKKEAEDEEEESEDKELSIEKALKAGGTRLLVAVAEYDVNVYKSTRNLAGVAIKPVSDLNALELLRPCRVLMTKAALDAFRQKVAGNRQAS